MSKNSFETEVALLRRCEDLFGLPSGHIVSALRDDLMCPLPDCFPPRPEWKSFEWPTSGDVDLGRYWREYDRGLILLGGFSV